MWQQRNHNADLEQAILNQSEDKSKGKNKLLARLLAQRKINPNDIDGFIEASYNDMTHPHSFVDMEKAVGVFTKVAQNNGNVAIIGDYDADGIISSAMLKEVCIFLDLPCHVFLPSRIKHGYGLNPETLKDFKAIMTEKNYKPDLLFVVDCGSNNEKEVLELKEFGVSKIIIIDHHIVDQNKISKSADALISWHLSNHDEMCACGEVYQFIRALSMVTKKINPIEFLSYAALGTIGDVSPLKGDNRLIVKNGLSTYALDHVVGHGLTSLIKESQVNANTITQSDISFKIIPRINAAGRMSDPYLAYKLFIEPNKKETKKIAQVLTKCNNARKSIQKIIETEATKEVLDHSDRYKHGILLYNPKWALGVLGIVASKIEEIFGKPTLILGLNKTKIKGSGRSNVQTDLKFILDNCSDLFESYGGHTVAAGVTLKPDMIEQANDQFNNACKVYKEKHNITEDIRLYDAELKASSTSIETSKLLLSSLYPYCKQTNPEPIFLISNVMMQNVELFEPKGWKILVFNASKNGEIIPLSMKMFTTKFGTEMENSKVDIYFSFPQLFNKNKYGKYQLDVIDIVKKV